MSLFASWKLFCILFDCKVRQSNRAMAKPTIILKDIRSNQSSESSIDFDIHNVDVSVVNSLRRIMWAEIPTLAIELVEIEINSSPLHDEYL